MLPPGHIAAGYLTAYALLKTTHPDITPDQAQHLIWWGMFFAFSPDFDTFVSFAQEKAWFVKNPAHNHRKLYSHIPILWLLAGLVIYFLAHDPYIKYIGLMVWLGSWSHFLLDSLDYGIMWLWPANSNIYSIWNKEVNFNISENTFFGYWWHFLKYYSKLATFYLEIIILLSTVVLLIHNS